MSPLTGEQPGQRLRRIDILILAALTIAGLIVTLKAPSLFFGIRILLGSCFSLTALLLYRSYWGVAVAVPSSLATIWMFGDPLTAIRLLGEIVVISWISQRKDGDYSIRSGRTIRHVAVYAVLVGCPFLYLTEVYLNGTSHDVALTLTYKNFINSIFNVLIAYVVYSWVELRRNKREDGSPHRISIKTLTSVVLMLGCILISSGLIIREFAIALDRGQMSIIQRNHSLAALIQRVHLTNPIKQVGDLAELLIAPDQEYSPKRAPINIAQQNEYDIKPRAERLAIVKPKDEDEVWYRLKLMGDTESLEYTSSFFKDTLPKLRESNLIRLISPQLKVLTPIHGSRLDRLMAGYWIYTHPDNNYAEPKEIEVFTPLFRYVNILSQASNASLKLLAEVVIMALFISNIIANKLTNEWIAIIPKRQVNGELVDMEELYKQSPITEIGSSVDSINKRTSQIIIAKKEIEYLNSIAQRQLSTAAEIQSFFLTKSFPLELSYDVIGVTRPAYDVGGDWYDAFTINDNSFFVVADVCDKGVGAALFMSVFRTLIRYSTRFSFSDINNEDPRQALIDVISNVNHYMSTNHGSCMYFATVFFGHIHEKTSELSYVSAGHETVLLRKKSGELVELQTTGPALGIFENATYACSSASFEPEDVVLAYSDGVIDARNPNQQSYGIERLQTFFEMNWQDPIAQMQSNLLQEVDVFMQGSDQFDDITVMFIKRRSRRDLISP